MPPETSTSLVVSSIRGRQEIGKSQQPEQRNDLAAAQCLDSLAHRVDRAVPAERRQVGAGHEAVTDSWIRLDLFGQNAIIDLFVACQVECSANGRRRQRRQSLTAEYAEKFQRVRKFTVGYCWLFHCSNCSAL